MINLNLRRKAQPKPQTLPEVQIIDVGDLVRRNSDGAIGVLRRIDLSPYWIEERAGVVRGYVVFEGFTDWCLAEELGLVAKATVLTAALAS